MPHELTLVHRILFVFHDLWSGVASTVTDMHYWRPTVITLLLFIAGWKIVTYFMPQFLKKD